MIPQREVRRALRLAGKFWGKADRLQGFLELSREEQEACFPGEGFGVGEDWVRVGQMALKCVRERRFV